MNAFSVTLSLAIFLTVFITPVAAQWDAEHEYVLSTTQSLPVKSVEVYLGSSYLVRVYHFDFFRNYTGFTDYTRDGKKDKEEVIEYDERNFLKEHTQIMPQGEGYSIFYEYDSTGNQIRSAKYWFRTSQGRDSIKRQINGEAFNFKCTDITITEYNENRLPVEVYLEYNSNLYLKELHEYKDNVRWKISHIKNDTVHYDEVWICDALGRKTQHWIKKDDRQLIKTEWTYDSKGRIGSVTRYNNTRYGYSGNNSGQKKAQLIPHKTMSTSVFSYDKKGRVSSITETLGDGRKGPETNFKYIEPDK